MKGKGKRNRTNKWKFNMMKMKSSKANWTGRKGQLFLHVFLKYIYAYVNKSILKLNICVCLSVSVLLHYNCMINANIQGVYHRPNLERACNVGCRLLLKILGHNTPFLEAYKFTFLTSSFFLIDIRLFKFREFIILYKLQY